MKAKLRKANITAVGKYLPKNILSNTDLEIYEPACRGIAPSQSGPLAVIQLAVVEVRGTPVESSRLAGCAPGKIVQLGVH